MNTGDGSPAEETLIAEAQEVFPEAFPQLKAFADLLYNHGQERGLIGPRELPRLWSRHIVNSLDLCTALPAHGDVLDVGTGAGFPGIVLAIAQPQTLVLLVDSMQRRIDWLEEVVTNLGLKNVRITRSRIEDLSPREVQVDTVTARAVAPLATLAEWVLPYVKDGGHLLAIKGERAEEEIQAAKSVCSDMGATGISIEEYRALPSSTGVRVVNVSIDRRVASDKNSIFKIE